ncbi:MAG: DUF1080 domain-containing protein [Verrucomicrobia bacterium]|nr:DUF1080 domain-containing protein [Verrucomicrobiota bacterium]
MNHLSSCIAAAFLALLSILPSSALEAAEAPDAIWKSLFNGRDLTGWDTYLGPPPGSSTPIGLNTDPRRVFTVVEVDGTPAIRISGEVYGAITTKEEFENFHIRVEYKWGTKRWPPRANVGRDSGILYCCIGPHGAGSGAWMRSAECNIMERATGQFWSVAGSFIDIEGERVTPEMEKWVPYKKEGAGESLIVYKKGAPKVTSSTGDGVTPNIDYEIYGGAWNVCEVIFWGGTGIHILNGKANLVLTNPRYKEGNRTIALTKGKIQLQSEAAEIFYRKVEIRPIVEVPKEFLQEVPLPQAGEEGFVSLFGKDANDGWSQCGPGHFTLENGAATGHGGMGLWWHKNKQFGNFILRGEFMQEQEIADSGVFVRFPDPVQDPWIAVRKGHEVEIGDPKPANAKDATGSIYPFHGPVEVPVKPLGEWNDYEIVCNGHNYSVRLNGKLINTWTDTSQRSSSGYIGLQNYNDGKVVRHRKLRIRELP